MESRYAQEVSKYGKKDGIAAFCVCIGITVLVLADMAINNMISAPWYVMGLISIVRCSLAVVGVIIVVKVNKKSLSSIGLHKSNLGKAIGLGFLFGLIPITFFAVVPGVISGFAQVNLGILFTLVMTFFYAAHEDVVFVGFVQTRLYGLFKTHRAAICVGAILFAAMHVPPWLLTGQLDLGQPLVIIQTFLGWAAIHFVFVSVFKKYFSLVPVFILHTLWGFSSHFAQAWTIDFSLIVGAVAVSAACFLYWQSYRKEKLSSQQ